jgi:glycosyltransferase involved in cell wall biosynthesis
LNDRETRWGNPWRPHKSDTRSGTSLRVWVSGWTHASSGIGVLQRALYPRLDQSGSFQLVLGPPQRRAALTGPVAKAALGSIDLARQAMTPASGDAILISTTPTPLFLNGPTVGIVMDLRWTRTRTRLASAYRFNDLRRLVHRAVRLACISERTLRDLVSLMPEATAKAQVVHLGPGQVSPSDFSIGEPGTVLMVGRAAHKRNVLAARALASVKPSWLRRVVGVALNEEAQDILESAFGAERCEWHSSVDRISMAMLYSRAEIFIGLSTEEGFGLPFLEALTAGCLIIAVRQEVTEEVLGDSAILIEDGTAEAIAGQLQQIGGQEWPSVESRRSQAARYSWDSAASAIAQMLRDAAS